MASFYKWIFVRSVSAFYNSSGKVIKTLILPTNRFQFDNSSCHFVGRSVFNVRRPGFVFGCYLLRCADFSSKDKETYYFMMAKVFLFVEFVYSLGKHLSGNEKNMRLGGRLQAAIEVLQDIRSRRRPAAEALKDWGLSHRFAGAGDRAAIGNIVYDVLRERYSLEWRMDSDDPHDTVFGALLAEGGLCIDELAHTLEGDRFAPEKLSETCRQNWQKRKLADAPDYIQGNLPQWCVPLFGDIFASRWLEEAAALAQRPPLDLRVNLLKTKPEKVLRELAGTNVSSIPWYSEALRIPPIEKLKRHPNVQAEPAFQKGLFEVQDLGSQIVARLAGAKAGMQVLDYCAGAGGKTLAMASDMENRGQIHCYDAEKARLAPIFDRLRRAGVRNVQPHVNIKDLEQLKGQMDLVLLDAPCTGTGTWRRRPDAKWRLTDGQLERRVGEQKTVLNATMPYLKKGGHLVYITCSLLSSENDRQIAAFLKENRDFQEVDMKALWLDHFGEYAPKPVFPKHGLVLSPASTDTDGFFISVLEKR